MHESEDPNLQLQTLSDDDLTLVRGGVQGSVWLDPSHSETDFHGSDFNDTHPNGG